MPSQVSASHVWPAWDWGRAGRRQKRAGEGRAYGQASLERGFGWILSPALGGPALLWIARACAVDFSGADLSSPIWVTAALPGGRGSPLAPGYFVASPNPALDIV